MYFNLVGAAINLEKSVGTRILAQADLSRIKQNKVLSDTALGFYLPKEAFSLNLIFERVSNDRDYPQQKFICIAHYTYCLHAPTPIENKL